MSVAKRADISPQQQQQPQSSATVLVCYQSTATKLEGVMGLDCPSNNIDQLHVVLGKFHPFVFTCHKQFCQPVYNEKVSQTGLFQAKNNEEF